jgi:UDP-N-acetylglucosamine--N-acetylmuramyl-(pentapeptide) pyrophosphoryl-undecaprenol N-acetylglucosamine transferase
VAENHQEKNARALEREGAAVVLLEKSCSGELLYRTVNELLEAPDRLRAMSENMQKFASPDAIEKIYQTVCELAYRKRS